jgi:hypothetical protein
MDEDLKQELERGHQAAKAIVQHMEDMGGASWCEFPVSHVDRNGNLQEWKVTAEIVSVIKEEA